MSLYHLLKLIIGNNSYFKNLKTPLNECFHQPITQEPKKMFTAVHKFAPLATSDFDNVNECNFSNNENNSQINDVNNTETH